jgi:Protein of unknown function (DUF2510)
MGDYAPIAGWYEAPDNPALIEFWDGQKWTGHQAAPEPELQSVGAQAPMAPPMPAAAPNPFAPADPATLPPPVPQAPQAPASEGKKKFPLSGRVIGLIAGVIVLVVAVALILKSL